MSVDVNVCIWPGESNLFDRLQLFQNALECVAIPQHRLLTDNRALTRFGRIRACTADSSNVVYDKVVDTNETYRVLEELVPFLGPSVHYRIDSAFDRVRYENWQIESTVAPLDIHYYGSEYGWRGQNYKRLGAVVFYFSNTKVFRIPDDLIRDIKLGGRGGSPQSPSLAAISQLSQNFEAVNGLARRLIEKVNPVHLLVCTEAEVHPLTAHALYHRDWQDYVLDLNRIARLHQQGGAYFCDVEPDEPAFSPPRKFDLDYGYLRIGSHRGEFLENLEILLDAIGRRPAQARDVSKELMEECLCNLDESEVKKINDSYYITSSDGPFGYIDEVYFELCGLLASDSRKSDQRGQAPLR